MLEFFRFVGKYQGYFYFLFFAVGLSSARWLWKAWKEWRVAYFSLEREMTMRRLAQAALVAALAISLTCGVFTISTFVVPGLPAAILSVTPTLDLLATPLGGVEAVSQAALSGATPAPQPVGSQGCIAGKLEVTAPRPGDELSGIVTLTGTVNLPNLGFYKYELALRGSDTWTPISADNGIRINEKLGDLNTDIFTPGDYLLRVTAVDNDTQVLGACIITIRIKGQ